MLSDHHPVCPVCNIGVLWPNGWTDQDETWHVGRPRSWPHCVRWGPSSPSPKGERSPNFLAHICCSQFPAGVKMPLGMELGLGPGDFVLNADPAPPSPNQFSAHVYCGQTAGWMKLVLGMEVGLIPCDFMLDGDPAPPPQKGQSSHQIFGPCLLWPNGWMDQDGIWHGGRPQPRRLYVR